MNRFVWIGLFLAACSGDEGKDTGTTPSGRVEEIMALTPDTANGADLYATNCAICHGDSGEGIEGLGSNVQNETDQAAVITVVLEGNDDGMTSFDGLLTDQEIADVSAFVVEGDLGP